MNTCEFCNYFELGINEYNVTWTNCQCPKILENAYGNKNIADDTLEYSYNEGGSFSPGKNFGCIHWLKKEQS